MRVWTTLRASFAAAALALALTPHPAAAAQPATRPADRADRPNVVVIVTDDQGSVDAGCYGVTDLVTPNIDALAARGVRFTQFYAAAPLCSPSRAALLTGKTPQRAGLPGQAASQAGGGGMPAAQTTMAEVYKAAGYATGHVGKWHLGYDRGTMPLDQGFDSSFGFMGGCIDNYSHFYYWGGPNAHDLWRDGQEVWDEGQFFGDLVVNESGRFIAANKDKPFFLYVAINMPHYPLQGIAKWRERYKELPSPRDKYAAAMSTADEQIGGVLAALDAGGLRENTIVVYMSDHGHSTEDARLRRRRQRRAVPRGQVQPLRGRHPRAGRHQLARPPARGRGPRPDGRRGRLAADHGRTQRRAGAGRFGRQEHHRRDRLRLGRLAARLAAGRNLLLGDRQRAVGRPRGQVEARRQPDRPDDQGAGADGRRHVSQRPVRATSASGPTSRRTTRTWWSGCASATRRGS